VVYKRASQFVSGYLLVFFPPRPVAVLARPSRTKISSRVLPAHFCFEQVLVVSHSAERSWKELTVWDRGKSFRTNCSIWWQKCKHGWHINVSKQSPKDKLISGSWEGKAPYSEVLATKCRWSRSKPCTAGVGAVTLAEGFASPCREEEQCAHRASAGGWLKWVTGLCERSGGCLDECHGRSPGPNPALQDTITSITLPHSKRKAEHWHWSTFIFTSPFSLKPSENFFPS